MVHHPGEYRWSSYGGNAQGREDKRLWPHADYVALGPDAEGRRGGYRELFRYQLDPELVEVAKADTEV